MSTINYSKWDHIEISDDEDDTHPNIDTPSLFRWRHQARVERMEEAKKKKEKLEKEKQSHQQKMAEIKQKLKGVQETSDVDFEKLKLEESELEKQERAFKKKEEELKKEERLTPWNIDTICHEGKSKTIINKVNKPARELTDEEKAERQQEFSKKYKTEIRKFGMMQRYEDSQQFLQENPHLVCEETANYLVIWCIDLEVEEKHDLMKHVSHQTIVMQFILELARSLEQDPRSCVRAFFSRIKLAEKQYMDAFNDELNSFRERVKGRAQARIEEAIKEYEEEERQKRLGPGGLDPVEVMESLPEELRECFESRDIGMLQQAIMKMDKEQAEYHIKRCVDSGLWVPNAADAEKEEQEGEGAVGGSSQEVDEEDKKYEEVD
ncbi:hsp90 co-chaperone Cdc37-like isoform X2 [Babylonia areolata]|uniref:hsp90 co-chaperone Cdc37-like isoform X2 n=1 Tax=Babylonia areolata TaxID=304850 RepID=UPI003FD3FE81